MNGVKTKKMVFLGLSGGVDSSVAALLLKEKGYEVIGIFMKCWGGPSAKSFDPELGTEGLGADCTAHADATDARRVAEKLGISFYVWDFEEEYKRRVVDYMVEGYRRGETPNPDVMCNKEIKFGLFLERALRMGGDCVATGHYVRITEQKNSVFGTHFARPATRSLVLAASSRRGGNHAEAAAGVSRNRVFSLFSAKDTNKDQSYFLWTLTQDQLAHCLFPIGDYLKSEVREMARQAGLATADKKDSQGICFLGRVRLDEFLGKYIKPKLGQVRLMERDGSYKIVGEHHGAHLYTIGQRHGIGLGGGTPYYVAEKDVKTNTLVVAPSATDQSLYRKEIELTDINFIRPIAVSRGLAVHARVRYRQPLASATLYQLPIMSLRDISRRETNYKLIFDEPVKFVAPGQSAVFYSTDGPASASASADREMLGGGIIRYAN